MDPIHRTAASGTPLVSAHARARMQQRGIRPEALEALLAFGSERHLPGQGCDIVYFDKTAKKRLAKAAPAAAREAGRFIWGRVDLQHRLATCRENALFATRFPDMSPLAT